MIGELEALVAEHPLRERLHAQRMLALYRSGRQSEALDAYRQARDALVEQIGVEPGAELQRLQHAILAHDPALDRPAPAPPARPPPSQPAPARPPPPPHWIRCSLAVAVLSAAAGLLAFGVSRVTAPDRLPRIDENSVGVIDPDGGRITAQYAVGRSPAAVVAGGDSVWVANALRRDRVADRRARAPSDRADRRRRRADRARVRRRLAVGRQRRVAQRGAGRSRLEPGRAAARGRQRVARRRRRLRRALGGLRVRRRRAPDRPRDRAATSRSIPIGANPSAIAAGAGAIWVASEEAGTITRLDPRTGAVVKAIPVGNGTSAVAVGEGAVWAVNRPDGTVSRIDPRTNAVTWALDVGGDPAAIAAGDGGVWVAGGAPARSRASTRTRRESLERDRGREQRLRDRDRRRRGVDVRGRPAGEPPRRHAAGHRAGQAARDGADRLAGPVRLRPATSYQLISLAYDGLVGYRRTAGAAGATLVGALATDVPEPSPDGRTYVFTLRPGLRYSDGTPVRARGLPRLDRALPPGDARQALRAPFYEGIVGAERCVTAAGSL